jgi:hypothetical protein
MWRSIGRANALVALTIAAVLAAPAIAGATDITVNDDTTGPGPAGANCAAPDQATITGALAAAAASGDRILVCAGTYSQPQLLITKSVDLIGAGPGQSIIDGQNATGLPLAGLIRPTDAVNGDLLVQGFTVQNAGQVGTSPTASHIAVIPKGDDLGKTQDYNDLEIIGRGTGGRDYGIDLDNPDPDVIFRNSSVIGTDFNPVLIERADGAVTIRNNEIAAQNPSTGIFTMVHSSDGTVNPIRISGNRIDAKGGGGMAVQSTLSTLAPGTINSVSIHDNTVTNVGTVGLSVTNPDPNANGLAGDLSNVDIHANRFAPTTAGNGTGVRVSGRVRNVAIDGNTITDFGTGVLIDKFSSGHSPIGVSAHSNRIAGNATAGLTSNAAEPVEATDNWWGCNEGPGQPGCDAVNGSGTVDADPWLIFGLSANPTSILTGGETSRLDADLLTNSDLQSAGAGFPQGTQVDFATTLGTVTSPVGTGGSIATSTLASGSQAGTADVTATLDGETASVQVAIADPPPAFPDTTIDSGPAQGSSTNDATPTFTFSSDDPAATFECRYDGGAWGACSGPGASHTPAADLAAGIHTFEVRAVDATATPDPSPAGRTFLVQSTETRQPDEVKPGSELDLDVDPRSARIAAGQTVKYRATVDNSGAGAAHRVRVCVRTPGKLTLDGEGCKQFAQVDAASTRTAKFKVAVPKGTPARLYRVKFTVRSADANRDDRTRARIRVADETEG